MPIIWSLIFCSSVIRIPLVLWCCLIVWLFDCLKEENYLLLLVGILIIVAVDGRLSQRKGTIIEPFSFLLELWMENILVVLIDEILPFAVCIESYWEIKTWGKGDGRERPFKVCWSTSIELLPVRVPMTYERIKLLFGQPLCLFCVFWGSTVLLRTFSNNSSFSSTYARSSPGSPSSCKHPRVKVIHLPFIFLSRHDSILPSVV